MWRFRDPMTTEQSGADALFAYTEGGIRFVLGYEVLISRIVVPGMGGTWVATLAGPLRLSGDLKRR